MTKSVRRRYTTLYERLIANIHADLVTNNQSCWLWARRINNKGYGRLNIRKHGRIKVVLVHRLMYELIHGDIQPGYEVDHECGQCSCINPDHLRTMTVTENSKRRWGR